VALLARPGRVVKTIHNNFEFKGGLRLRRAVQRRILHLLGIAHIAIGPSVQENELSNFGLKTHLVPNWYDDKRFLPVTDSARSQARSNLGILPHETVIVTVGNCSKIKNHESLLHALALLSKASRPIYLHVGNEEHGQPERKLANELGIGDCIRFMGSLTDIRPALEASDIFVMPSLFEGFSIAALEALAMGLPAIFTDVPGLRDFRADYNGICYASPDATSLRDALAELLAECQEVRLLRAKAYPEVSRLLYGVSHGVAGYLEVYRGN
jgi:glycosyltransferase involved in cell wall biosynthesis